MWSGHHCSTVIRWSAQCDDSNSTFACEKGFDDMNRLAAQLALESRASAAGAETFSSMTLILQRRQWVKASSSSRHCIANIAIEIDVQELRFFASRPTQTIQKFATGCQLQYVGVVSCWYVLWCDVGTLGVVTLVHNGIKLSVADFPERTYIWQCPTVVTLWFIRHYFWDFFF